MPKNYKPVVLIVLDGFGVNLSAPESTWKHAEMPTFREMEKYYPYTTLQASGVAVGLPWGVEGNSEVGHFTMGAGKALYLHLPRIIMSIHDGSFFKNTAFVEAGEFVKKDSGGFHIMGLFSSGSVHAYMDHLYALLDFAKNNALNKTYLHLFTDGRDAPPKEAAQAIALLEERLAAEYPFVKIASVIGRAFAMDRDDNWDKIATAYRCLTEGSSERFRLASQYVTDEYNSGSIDETLPPASLDGNEGRIQAGDAVVFYNFREDSARELTSAFISDNFSGFDRKKIADLFFVTMTEYDKRFPARVAFSPLDVTWPLARVISDAGLKQLHIAETEKYAHVTYFFNGGKEQPYDKEERILIPSPQVPSFDEVPEMSASKIMERVMENISNYDFILINFANADMVGHTGNFKATVNALEILDFSVGALITKIMEIGGVAIVTADHGNAEEKIYSQTGEKRTKHTANPIPFFVVANEFKKNSPRTEDEINLRYKKVGGLLSDVAPTVIQLLGLRKPGDMTGVDILPKIL